MVLNSRSAGLHRNQTFFQKVFILLTNRFCSDKLLFILSLISLGVFSTSPAFAWNWCIPRNGAPPCGGAPGRCTVNSNLSRGGFVADTASIPTNFLGLNSVYLERYTEVCDTSLVHENAAILNYASVQGNSEIKGAARVGGSATVRDSLILDRAQVTERAFVSDSTLQNRSYVGGQSDVVQCFLMNRARVTGDSHISNQVLINNTHWHDVVAHSPHQAQHFAAQADDPREASESSNDLVVDRNGDQNRDDEESEIELVFDTDDRGIFRQNQLEQLKEDWDAFCISEQKEQPIDRNRDWMECPLCYEVLLGEVKVSQFDCGHLYCTKCLKEYKRLRRCPKCDKKFHRKDFDVTQTDWHPKSRPNPVIVRDFPKNAPPSSGTGSSEFSSEDDSILNEDAQREFNRAKQQVSDEKDLIIYSDPF